MKKTIKIDKNVPVPTFGSKSKYPWEKMNVGDSFFAEGGKIHNVSACASYAGKKHRWKFSCRTVDGGVRVWRIK